MDILADLAVSMRKLKPSNMPPGMPIAASVGTLLMTAHSLATYRTGEHRLGTSVEISADEWGVTLRVYGASRPLKNWMSRRPECITGYTWHRVQIGLIRIVAFFGEDD